MRPGSGVVLHPQPPPGQSLLLLPLDLGGGALDLRLQLAADKHFVADLRRVRPASLAGGPRVRRRCGSSSDAAAAQRSRRHVAPWEALRHGRCPVLAGPAHWEPAPPPCLR